MTARATIRQCDIARAIKAAQDSGLTSVNIPVPVAFCSAPIKPQGVHTMILTREEIAGLPGLLHTATKGPWESSYTDYGDEIWFGGTGCGMWNVGPAVLGGKGLKPGGIERMAADAALVSRARDMAETIVALQAELDAIRAKP